MKRLILTATLLLLPGLAIAAPLTSTDGNANYGCGWQPADNGGGFLTVKDDCAGIPVITGGSTTDRETYTVDLGCGTATVTERVTTADRGGAVEGREVESVSFK
jgi:hypothetical protein